MGEIELLCKIVQFCTVMKLTFFRIEALYV